MTTPVEEFIAKHNIAHYADLLKTETDPIKRETLQSLMANEQAKLANNDNQKVQ